MYCTFPYTFFPTAVQPVAHRNVPFGSQSHTSEELTTFVMPNLALRALCLMTQEHETKLRGYLVRNKVNSHGIVVMEKSFWWFCLNLLVSLVWGSKFCNCCCARRVTFQIWVLCCLFESCGILNIISGQITQHLK